MMRRLLLAVAIAAFGLTPLLAHAAPPAVRGTPVRQVLVLAPLNIRTGPGTHFHVVGRYHPGQQVAVTGISDDYNWWRVRCPRGGTCWISAKPTYTLPIAWR
jgi:Bacterial SH3 domain.